MSTDFTDLGATNSTQTSQPVENTNQINDKSFLDILDEKDRSLFDILDEKDRSLFNILNEKDRSLFNTIKKLLDESIRYKTIKLSDPFNADITRHLTAKQAKEHAIQRIYNQIMGEIVANITDMQIKVSVPVSVADTIATKFRAVEYIVDIVDVPGKNAHKRLQISWN